MAADAARGGALRLGVRLEVVTVLWMAAEAIVAIGTGVVARSVLLTAFGFDSVIELLRTLLPSGWELTDEPRDAAGDAAVITLKLSNSFARMLVEARRDFTPRDVASVLGGRIAQIRTMAGQISILIVAPWLSPQARERLAAENINYLDLASNHGFHRIHAQRRRCVDAGGAGRR